MHKTVVINAVGLTPSLIGPQMPFLASFLRGRRRMRILSVIPAVTCSVQATYLTGKWPAEHGIVGNGWYFKDQCEVKFWHQSNKLVQADKIWDIARRMDPTFTCANMFWWYNMHSSADFSVTPRPMYPADGRKLPDVYTQPAGLRPWLQRELGRFPLFHFWGPATNVSATQWIADASILVDQKHNPTLTLIYLPHLDYCMQKQGPNLPAIARDLRELDDVCRKLVEYYEKAGASVVILSEYGITAVSRPVHLNRRLREAGLVAVRDELGRELLDPGASAAFAVADHQVAHVYVNDKSRLAEVRKIIEATEGVARVLDDAGKREYHLDHNRGGDLVALAAADAWFTYYYWLDDARAPDFARAVDIHRKPGYDPAELFIDPAIAIPPLKIAWTLLKKKLGFRTVMQLIPLSGDQVKGSHGLEATDTAHAPMLMSNRPDLLPATEGLSPTDVCGVLLRHLEGG